MKKTKKILIMSILAISTFILCGMTNVKAAAFSLTNTDIVCDPAELEKGERAECYIIGVPSETGESVNGYVVYAYTTKYLMLKGANYKVANTGAALTAATSASATKIATKEDMPDKLKDFTCEYDGEGINAGANTKTFGCGVFYTKKGSSSNAFTPATIKNTGINEKLLPMATFGVIGSLTVELDEKAEGNECGEMCVKVWRVPTEENYINYKTCGNDAGNPNSCGSDSGNDYKCKEIHYKVKQEYPDTGAFASYALLAACALVAISAIALSKKNNKFSRI